MPKGISLNCQQKNDSLTKKDNNNGTATLKYAIAILTTDESFLAGGQDRYYNNLYYLTSGNYYWVLTPKYFNNGTEIMTVDYAGNISDNGGRFMGGVKPVINLKSNSLKLGDGTINNPYVVE